MKSVVRWLWLPAVLALAWPAWVLWSRRADNAALERQVEHKEAEADRKVLRQLGGDELRILMFYPNPPVVAKGSPGLLCYGVSNAKSVKIEPAGPDVNPSLSRCVEVRPTRDTQYTLRASDGKGGEVTQTVEVGVR